MSLLLPSTTTCIFLGVVFCLGYVLYRAALPRPIPGIPYNESAASSLLGDIPSLMNHQKTSPVIFKWILAQSIGLQSPICQLFIKPFSRPTVVLTDPREIHDIFLRRTKEFDRDTGVGDVFGGTVPEHHIIQPTNERWRAQRRLLADTMTTGFLHNVAAPHLHAQIIHLLNLWHVKVEAAANHPFGIFQDVNHMALDSIWAVSFGTAIDTIKTQKDALQDIAVDASPDEDEPVVFPAPVLNDACRAIMILNDGVESCIKTPSARLTHFVIRQKPSWKKAKAIQEKLLSDRLVDAERRLVHKDATDDMIKCATDHMVRREQQAAAKEGRKPAFDTPVAKDELFGYLVAGYDTTSTTAAWGMKWIADNPLAQSRLRTALRAAFPATTLVGGRPTYQAIVRANIPFLDAMLEEILRCSCAAQGSTRVTLQDAIVLGHLIPKGTTVMALNIGPGFSSPDTYNIKEADRSQSSRDNKAKTGEWDTRDMHLFNPERWLKTDDYGNVEFDSRAGPTMPFGYGVRGCFGKRLAYLELRILFALVVWEFEFKRCPERLSGYAGIDGFTHKPLQCYARLVPVRNGAEDVSGPRST